MRSGSIGGLEGWRRHAGFGCDGHLPDLHLSLGGRIPLFDCDKGGVLTEDAVSVMSDVKLRGVVLGGELERLEDVAWQYVVSQS